MYIDPHQGSHWWEPRALGSSFRTYCSINYLFSDWEASLNFLCPGGCCSPAIPESKACSAAGGPKSRNAHIGREVQRVEGETKFL